MPLQMQKHNFLLLRLRQGRIRDNLLKRTSRRSGLLQSQVLHRIPQLRPKYVILILFLRCAPYSTAPEPKQNLSKALSTHRWSPRRA